MPQGCYGSYFICCYTDVEYLWIVDVRTDTTGPDTTKYFADGEVYYTYNFIEKGAGSGNMGYPWGGDLLELKTNISLLVGVPNEIFSDASY